jgi:hypothetical protein
MGYQSQSGYLILKRQTTPDTFEATTPTAGAGFYTRTGGLAPNRDLLVPDPEIGGIRDVVDAYLGPVSFTGDLELYARLKHLGSLLGGSLGSFGTPVTATGISTHTFTPIDTGALPWFSIEQNLAGNFETLRYTDCKFNTFHLEADATGYLMCTAGLVARKQIAGSTPITSSAFAALADASPLIVGTNITITYNGVTLPAKSFSLDVNNNLEDDDFRLGSFFLGDTTEKRRDVTIGVTLRPQDSALWRQATYGLPAATAPGGVTTKQQVVITMSSYEDIPGGTPATKYSLAVTVPKAVITPFAVDVSGDDVIEHDLEIRAVRPATATPIMTAVLKTDAPLAI